MTRGEPMKAKYLCALAVLPAALLGIACSGEDAPTQEDYIAQADEICREADEALDAVIQEDFGTQQPSRQDLTEFTTAEAVPNLEGQLEELRALTPPEGDEETVNAIYESLSAAIEKIAADPLAAIDQPPADFQEASRLASEYGMEECGAG